MTLTNTGARVPVWTLANRLRQARETAGMDIQDLVEATGISRTTVTNYEHGYRTPRTVYLRAWAQATGVDLGWLETGKAPVPSEEETGANVRPKGFEPLAF
jgi:transcriptional regulator with XRE-family HTH domain